MLTAADSSKRHLLAVTSLLITFQDRNHFIPHKEKNLLKQTKKLSVWSYRGPLWRAASILDFTSINLFTSLKPSKFFSVFVLLGNLFWLFTARCGTSWITTKFIGRFFFLHDTVSPTSKLAFPCWQQKFVDMKFQASTGCFSVHANCWMIKLAKAFTYSSVPVAQHWALKVASLAVYIRQGNGEEEEKEGEGKTHIMAECTADWGTKIRPKDSKVWKHFSENKAVTLVKCKHCEAVKQLSLHGSTTTWSRYITTQRRGDFTNLVRINI